MNRRALLKLAPAALAATTAPAAALCIVDPLETPVMRLFREWQAGYEYLESPATDGIADEMFNAELDRVNALAERLVDIPSENAQDVCAKIVAFTYNGSMFPDDGGRLSKYVMADACKVFA